MEPYVTLDEAQRMADEAARKAVVSLCGLVLRRSQEVQFTRLGERNIAEEVVASRLAEIFGEALQQYSDPSTDPSKEEAEAAEGA